NDAQTHEEGRAEAGAEGAGDDRRDPGAWNDGGDEQSPAIGEEGGEGHGRLLGQVSLSPADASGNGRARARRERGTEPFFSSVVGAPPCQTGRLSSHRIPHGDGRPP